MLTYSTNDLCISMLPSLSLLMVKPMCLCPTLCNPVDYSLPDSSVHEILQARILEWFKLHLGIYVCVCVCVCVCVICGYVYIYVHTYIYYHQGEEIIQGSLISVNSCHI